MSVHDIRVISQEAGTPFVPPIADEDVLSERWEECEYRCFVDATGKLLGGTWAGEPGDLRLDPYPYDEICIIQEGRVALVDLDGEERTFGSGDAFFVPRSFSGTWRTIEPTRKIFIAFADEGHAGG